MCEQRGRKSQGCVFRSGKNEDSNLQVTTSIKALVVSSVKMRPSAGYHDNSF